ncbi:hypothetical protein [Amycolatopsis thermoflava]|uniref:hypothetical protein n=1 Tax=Amycolatopsis thermoflava TaxID=84480 RepID=UPI003824F799
MSTIPEDLRAAIIEAMLADDGPPSHRALAERFGVSKGTIYNIARDADLSHLWEERTARTEAATAANAAELARRRTELQAGLLDDIATLREKLFGDVIHLNVVKCGEGFEQVEQTVLPAGPSDWRNTMGAITGATAQTIGLARLDAENTGAGQASGLLEQFEASLRDARHERERQSREDGDG